MERSERRDRQNKETCESHRQHYTPETTIIVRNAIRPVDHIEAHLKALRRNIQLPYVELARRAGISASAYRRFEEGERRDNKKIKNKIVDTISSLVDENNEHALGAVTLITAQDLNPEKRARIQTYIDDAAYKGKVIFTRNREAGSFYISQRQVEQTDRLVTDKLYDLYEDLTFGDSIMNIRQTLKLSKQEFAKKMGISRNHLLNMESGKYGTNLPGINRIINVSSINPESKFAQLLRLKARDIKPMTPEDLHETNVGMLVRYLRTLKGFTSTDLANAINRSPAHVIDVEIRGKTPHWVSSELPQALGITPNEYLYQLLEYKTKKANAPVKPEKLVEVIHGKFVFADSANKAA